MRNLPPGVQPAEDQSAEAITELFGGFLIAIFAGIGLTFGVLVLLFRGFFKPVVIMAALPLCLIGAFASLLRSAEHTSELQSLMRHSYAVFCLKKQTPTHNNITISQL